METALKKNELFEKLRGEILAMQGFHTNTIGEKVVDFGLGPVQKAFPGGVFPTAGIHEFLSQTPDESAATSGFIATLIGRLIKQDGICLWVGTNRTVYPLALSYFGVSPDRIIFIDLKKEKDLLWVIEEGLKCNALAAVVGEIRELGLTESRRLQLVVEDSRVTGLLHRVNPRRSSAVASVCRWQISPIPSLPGSLLPGLGFPSWQVTIEKVKHGEPGSWQLRWNQGHFEQVTKDVPAMKPVFAKVG